MIDRKVVTISKSIETRREIPVPFYYEAFFDNDYSVTDLQGRVSENGRVVLSKRTHRGEVDWEFEVSSRTIDDGDTSYMRGDHDSTREKFHKLFDEFVKSVEATKAEIG